MDMFLEFFFQLSMRNCICVYLPAQTAHIFNAKNERRRKRTCAFAGLFVLNHWALRTGPLRWVWTKKLNIHTCISNSTHRWYNSTAPPELIWAQLAATLASITHAHGAVSKCDNECRQRFFLVNIISSTLCLMNIVSKQCPTLFFIPTPRKHALVNNALLIYQACPQSFHTRIKSLFHILCLWICLTHHTAWMLDEINRSIVDVQR